MTQIDRDLSLDVFKGLAIYLITGYHLLSFLNFPTKDFNGFDLYAPFYKGEIGVALFIFISGYLTHSISADEHPLRFLKRKLLRIAAPYYIALLVWNLLIGCGVMSASKINSFIDNSVHILFIHNLHPSTFHSISGLFWYVGLQMQLYIMYILLKDLIIKRYRLALISALIISLLTNLLFPQIIKVSPEWLIVIQNSILTYAVLFIAGNILKNRLKHILLFIHNPLILLFLSVVTILWLFYKKYLTFYTQIEEIVFGLFLGILMIGLPKIEERHLLFRPLIILGSASYSIYLYNYIFWSFIPKAYEMKGFVTYSIITLAFGVAAYYLIEVPLLNRNINK